MKLLNTTLVAALCVMVAASTFAQTFTSSADGAFSTGSNWSGGTAPPLSGQGSGSVTVQNNMSITGNYTVGSIAFSVSANKTLTINGNLTESNSGGSIDVYGTLIVTGTLTASGNTNSFVIHPGGTVYIQSTASITSNNVISVGDNTSSGPPYASLAFESSLSLANGGAGMIVNKNGRVAVYGNITSGSGGGQTIQLNNGGQMYVNGNIALTGGGDAITNSNTTSPYGLYVNGTTSNSGGGSTTTGNESNKAGMQSGDPTLYSWVASLPGSPLPVTLTSFVVSNISEAEIQLTWMTASELNFDYFEVEKSTDGKNFSKIGQVQGHGTTNDAHTYTFEDKSPVIGENYYRLKSVDFDGYAEIFSVVMADLVNEKTASVYPNPLVDHSLHVDLNFEGSTTSITIVDTMGNLMTHTTSDEVQTMMPVYLNPGLYVVTVTNGSFKQVSRLLVK